MVFSTYYLDAAFGGIYLNYDAVSLLIITLKADTKIIFLLKLTLKNHRLLDSIKKIIIKKSCSNKFLNKYLNIRVIKIKLYISNFLDVYKD